MPEKTLGFVLIGLGVCIMVVALVYILLVFTGNRNPVQVFSIKAPTIDLGSMMAPSLPQGQSIPLPKTEIEVIPTEAFNNIINMSLTFFLMGFILNFGFKIASLGVMLVRPITVPLKQTSQPQQQV